MEHVALVVGESLVDVVHDRDGTITEYPGGSSANAAVALARLGRAVRFVTAYADDPHGRLLAEHLGDNAVQHGSDPLVLGRTATAIATLAESGSASYEFDIEWRIAPPGLAEGDVPVAVVFGSIGAALDPGAEQVADLVEQHRASALTIFDLNARPAITGTGPDVAARAELMGALADIVKASDEDLEALWPGRDLHDVADGFLARGSAAVVITRGEAGLMWVTEASRGAVSVVPIEVADTIGAGDTVTAAIVDAAWSHGAVGPAARRGLAALDEQEWVGVLAHAGRAAAVTVARPGADPPWRHELA